MALVNCPECKNEISDKSKICPHCGFKRKKIGLLGKIIIIFLIGLFIKNACDWVSNHEDSKVVSKAQKPITNISFFEIRNHIKGMTEA